MRSSRGRGTRRRPQRGLLNLILAAYLPATDERIREHLDVALDVFEEAGDKAMLAATLGETATLLGQGQDDWIMENLRRAVEIFAGIQVPYWQGHALMVLGILLQGSGDDAGSVERLAEGARHLEDCGDLSCWATSSRYLASAEARLGAPESAKRRLAAVVEQLPILPMQEIARPRTLDSTAEVLLAAGAPDRAAVVLGRAMATKYTSATIFKREPLHEAVGSGIREAIGDEETARLMAEGEALDVDETLGKALAWLQEG
jgi:hypothetical protein